MMGMLWCLTPSKTKSLLASMSHRSLVLDRKSTRLNSSHLGISYAVFCSLSLALLSFPTRRSSDLGFDFQAYDPPTHRLFLAHTGPNPDMMALAHTKFDPQYDGNVMVFDTQQDKIVARINVPQISGLRSEEHTSELQSLRHLVCRLLLSLSCSTLFPYTTLFRSWV